jgi:hypothetical protein
MLVPVHMTVLSIILPDEPFVHSMGAFKDQVLYNRKTEIGRSNNCLPIFVSHLLEDHSRGDEFPIYKPISL